MTSSRKAALAGLGLLFAAAPFLPASASHQVPGFEIGSSRFVDAITKPRVVAHMNELQWIADRHGGHRASGSSGYDASLAYVRRKLEDVGYKTVTQTFTFPIFEEPRAPVLRLTAPVPQDFVATKDFATMNFSAKGKLSGRIVPIDVRFPPPRAGSTSGCERSDFPKPGAGPAIALIQRGTCPFSAKVANAEAAGFDGVVIFNDGGAGGTDLLLGSLDTPSKVPAIGTTYALGRKLATAARNGGTAYLDVQTRIEERRTANLLAETATGRTGRTVIVGAHLDSVEEGPGINDNASGSAAVLELAIQMARQQIRPKNRIRFAWWGAEEPGLYGSKHFVSALSPAELDRIMVYLNVDMIASHNFVWHIQEGDPKNPADALVEEVIRKHFQRARLPYTTYKALGNSDYAPFMEAGIPIGGVFSGASDRKTARQAQLFGGTDGQPQDACYHKACDTNRFINRRSTRILSKLIADTAIRFGMTDRDIRDVKQ